MAEKRQKAPRKVLRPPAERQAEEIPGNAHSADWILVYIKNKTELILTLSRTGTHADLLRL